MSSRFHRRGVTAIEYGILAALIIVALLGILRVTGTRLESVFGQVGTTIQQTINPYPASSGYSFADVGGGVSGEPNSYTWGADAPVGRPDYPNVYFSYLCPLSYYGDYGYCTGVRLNTKLATMVIPGPNGYSAAGAFTLPETSSFTYQSASWTAAKNAGAGNFSSSQITSFGKACTAWGGTSSAGTNTFSCNNVSYTGEVGYFQSHVAPGS